MFVSTLSRRSKSLHKDVDLPDCALSHSCDNTCMAMARLSLGLGLLALLIGFAPNVSLAAQTNVTMGPNYFTPSSVTITAGDSVVWTNTDTMPHTVTSNTNAFNSGTMQPSATYSQTFNTPGTYQYYCAFHSGMVGTITVLAATTQPPPVTSPAPSSSTIADLQAQIQALLLRVQQLQQQTGGTVQVPVPGAPVVDSSACPLIGRILYIGSTGDDVSRLQQFLARDPSIYPERLVSGYYGPLTEAAVKRWQVKYNIVSSGTAATTGYGQVGPRTAAAMSLQCSTTSASAPNVGGFIRVTPISGNAPLTVSVEATVNTVNSCAGAVYTIDYGDGTGTTQITVPPGRCTQLVQTLSHIYQASGTYNVGLSSGPHRTVATVIVTGTTQPTPTTPATIPDSIHANPTTGQAPVTVSFSGTMNGARSCGGGTYTVDFGDNQNISIPYPADSCQAQSYSATHQYTQGGTYTAKLLRGSLSGQLATSTVITITSPVVEIGPFVVTPGIGGNPRTVEVEFNIATPCSAYDLDWGDGSAHVTQTEGSGSCTQVVTEKTFTHTYTQSGSYTITLVRGTRTDTASITITSF